MADAAEIQERGLFRKSSQEKKQEHEDLQQENGKQPLAMADAAEIQERGLFWKSSQEKKQEHEGLQQEDGEQQLRKSSQEKQEQQEDGEQQHNEGLFGKIKDFIQGTVGFGKPTAKVAGFHLPSINLERAEAVVEVLVSNPNPVPIPLVDIKYVIESEGRKLLSGTIPDAGTIRAHGSETIKIPLTLIYHDIKDTFDDIHPGEVIPYKVKVELIADVPVFGKVTLPIEKTGEIPVPYKPDIDVEKVVFEHLSFEETSADIHLKVENKNKFDLGINALDYEFKLADATVANANMSKSATIEKSGFGVVELPISFRPKDLGSAVWDIMRGRGAGYSMVGNLNVDTPFGPMHLPISKGGETKLKKKSRTRTRELNVDEDEGTNVDEDEE